MPPEEGEKPRTDGRIELTLPVRVQGYDADGTRWEEMTTGNDISSGGAAFSLQHAVVKGQALVLTLPLPKLYRTFDFSAASFRVHALVRVVERTEVGFSARTLFIGKQAPRGFEANPAIRYLLPGEAKPSPTERRIEQRFQLFLNLRIRRGEDGSSVEEQTVAENLSKGGARVLTTLPVAKGEVVWLEEIGGDFRTRAEVRSVMVGKDNVPRLGLKFLDAKLPDRLIAS